MTKRPLSPSLTPPALETQVWSERQSWDLMALFHVSTAIVKVEIHRDTSYEFQGRATVSAFDPHHRQFNLLATLPPPLMRCPGIDRLARDAGNTAQAALLFGPTVAELMRLALLILRPTTIGEIT